MSDPDWGRFGIQAPNTFGPLGDPVRWGASANVILPAQDAVTSFTATTQTGQILSVQCRDRYPRAWTIAGMIQTQAFEQGENALSPSYWQSSLYVMMGLGQTQIVHNFNVRAIVDADAPYYFPSVDFSTPFVAEGPQTYPFVIPGAVVGNSIGIQLYNQIVTSPGFPTPAYPITTSLIVTSFDPGATK